MRRGEEEDCGKKKGSRLFLSVFRRRKEKRKEEKSAARLLHAGRGGRVALKEGRI